MLVLSRKIGESIVISENVVVTVMSMKGGKIRLGFQAPPEVTVHRQEMYDKIKGKNDTLTFTGDNSLAAELEAAKGEFCERHLVLDFTKVRKVNGLDLSTVVGLHQRLQSRGNSLTLIGLDANVREVFAVTRLDGVLAIRDGPAKAHP